MVELKPLHHIEPGIDRIGISYSNIKPIAYTFTEQVCSVRKYMKLYFNRELNLAAIA